MSDEKETVAEISGISLCINNHGKVFLEKKVLPEGELLAFFNEHYPDLETADRVVELLREMNALVGELEERFHG